MRRLLVSAVAGGMVLLLAAVFVLPSAVQGREMAAGPAGEAAPARAGARPDATPAPRAGGGVRRTGPRARTAGPRAAPPARATGEPSAQPPLTTGAAVAQARRFAAGRTGTVAFAVLVPARGLRGLEPTRAFPSASVSKAMLLVAALRAAPDRALPREQRRLLDPMVTLSDNDAADAVYAVVGDPGLTRVARAAGMRRFRAAGAWSEARLTPGDQARLFLRIDRLVPARHRAYARTLLAGITAPQRWGIAEVVARRPGARVLFKGGWRKGLTHQAALVERGRRRLALVVMTEGGPSLTYDAGTIAGIARRVLVPGGPEG